MLSNLDDEQPNNLLRIQTLNADRLSAVFSLIPMDGPIDGPIDDSISFNKCIENDF